MMTTKPNAAIKALPTPSGGKGVCLLYVPTYVLFVKINIHLNFFLDKQVTNGIVELSIVVRIWSI